MEAWVYDPSDDHRTLPHKHFPNQPISEAYLKELGVLHWKIDADNWEYDPALEEIKKERSYVFWETITLAPGITDNFEERAERFFCEHLHPYDESRAILDGGGYWDIRDYDDRWIRFAVSKGDVIALPAGMYHRFTVDTANYVKALLLYKEIPSRVDLLRPDAENVDARKEYIRDVLNSPKAMHRPSSTSTGHCCGNE